jgi:probable FeS assembly SUF system protein SufT
MFPSEMLTLRRDSDVLEIPSGAPTKLQSGSKVRIMQNLGSTYTIATEYGQMYRLDGKDADALGLTVVQPEQGADTQPREFTEQLVWDQLKTVYDPEIPVNIADLGLIYSCVTSPLGEDGRRIDVKMSLTAPGCGMGSVLKADVERKLATLPTVREVNVEVVLDPPWSPARMSEAARLQLGFDL